MVEPGKTKQLHGLEVLPFESFDSGQRICTTHFSKQNKTKAA